MGTLRKALILLLIFGSSIPCFAQSPIAQPVIEIPYSPTGYKGNGWEERGDEWAKWLRTGIRIGGASGTMVHYEQEDNWMYVISCGHIFYPGLMSVKDFEKNPRDTVIEVFYHNNKKLSRPKEYRTQVLCYVWLDGVHDVSLMRFHPDWKNPVVSPVVPKDYTGDKHYHSIGCDGASEVAHYLVKYYTRRKNSGVYEIITTENSPRGGRSGGGLLNDKGELVGICSRAGGGYGYFSDWSQIHNFISGQGYGFVLKNKKNIPIIDRNNPQGLYEEGYEAFPKTVLEK